MQCSSGSRRFKAFHVLVSFIGIATGIVVLYGLVRSQRMSRITAIFLVTTLVTTLTGFFFHDHRLYARDRRRHHFDRRDDRLLLCPLCQRMVGRWRGIYVITAVISLYLNIFRAVVQLFLKVPVAQCAGAERFNEPPFAATQGAVLLFFLRRDRWPGGVQSERANLVWPTAYIPGVRRRRLHRGWRGSPSPAGSARPASRPAAPPSSS